MISQTSTETVTRKASRGTLAAMTKSAIGALFLVGITVTNAQASRPAFDYSQLDTDRDGRVTNAEAQIAPKGCKTLSIVKSADFNRDGVVTDQERHAGVHTMRCHGQIVRVDFVVS